MGLLLARICRYQASQDQPAGGGYGHFGIRPRRKKVVRREEAPQPVTVATKFPVIYLGASGDAVRLEIDRHNARSVPRTIEHPFSDIDSEMYAAAALLIAQMYYNDVNRWPAFGHYALANAGLEH